MKTFILTLGFGLITMTMPAQTQIYGHVKNDQNEFLSYTSIGTKSTKIGSISDKKGAYQLVLDESIKPNDSVVFSNSGYADRRISICDLVQNPDVILEPKSSEIETVVLKSQKLKEKLIGQKKRPMLTFTKFFDQNVPSIEQANIFQIYSTTKLKTYSFFIMPSSKFQEITLKLNIYNVKNNEPYRSVLSENIIHTTTTTGWQHIDLSAFKLMFRNMDQIAVSLQLVDHKKLPDEDFVFGISAKKSLSKNLLFRYQSQGQWEKSEGQFISNLEIVYDKKPNENFLEEQSDEIEQKNDMDANLSVYLYKDEANKSGYGKNKNGHFVDVNQAKIYYEIYGKGESLVLLHGNGGSISDFYKQIPFFAKHYQVIVLDTRGQGRSTNLSHDDYTYQMFSEDLVQMLKQLNISKTNIVGWSDGGNTGLILAQKHPEMINKLVTIGANLFPEGVEEKLLNEFKQHYQNSEINTDKRLLKLMLTEPQLQASDLENIKNPVLVIAGETDVIKIDHTKLIKNSIKNSDLFIIPKATHYVPFEQAKVMNEKIYNFLKN